jgi:hypothetical protein
MLGGQVSTSFGFFLLQTTNFEAWCYKSLHESSDDTFVFSVLSSLCCYVRQCGDADLTAPILYFCYF